MSELRAAAERVCDKWEPTQVDSPVSELVRDATLLAKAWLAEHPADSELPVTEEWLAAVGFQEHRSDLVGWTLLLPPVNSAAAIAELCVRIGDPLDDHDKAVCMSLVQGVPDTTDYQDDNVVLTSLPDIPSRGDVRLLARALGVPLKETTT